MILVSTSARSASGPSSSRATETTSASARSRSASRLIVIGLGCSRPHSSGANHRPRSSHRSSSQAVSAARSFTSHGSDCHRRLHSGRSISAMSRRFSIVSIRLATTALYGSGQCAGISVMGVDRCRLNHCVSISPAAIRRARTISNARSPSLSSGTLTGSAISSVSLRIIEQPVTPVDIPVQFFLERDHPAPDVLVFRPRRVQPFPRRHGVCTHRRRLHGAQSLRQTHPVPARTPTATPLGSGNSPAIRTGKFVEVVPKSQWSADAAPDINRASLF